MSEPAKQPAGPMRRDDGAVAMIDPSGEPVWVPPDQVSVAAGQGFRAESGAQAQQREDEIRLGTGGQIARTAIEGAARGATLGLSDAAAAYIDPEIAAEMGQRRDVNPLAATGGEIAGAIAPALLSGGAGAAGTAARLTPAGQIAALGARAEGLAGGALSGLAARGTLGQAASRGLTMAASGAVEGAAFGVGSAVSEAALTNTDLTAEKLLVGGLEGLGLGAGAGFGMGAAGGLLSGLGRGASRAGKVADDVAEAAAGAAPSGGGLLTRELDDLANRQTLKSLGLQGSDVAKLRGKLGDEGAARVARRLHEEGIISVADDVTARAAKLQARVKQAGEELGSIIKRADAEGVSMPTGLEVMKRLRTEVVDAKFGATAIERAANQPLIKKLEREVLGPLAKADQAGDMTLESLWKFRKTLDGKTFKEFGQTTGGAESLRAARGIIEDEIEKTIAKHSPDLGAAYSKAKTDYRDFGDLSKATTKRAGMEEGNRFMSLSDNMMAASGITGGLATGDVENAAYGAGLGLLNRFARTRGTVAAAKIARRLADVNMRRASAVRAIVDEAAPKPRVTQAAKRLPAGFDPTQVTRMALLATDDAAAPPLAIESPGKPDKEFPVVLASIQRAAADPVAYTEHIGQQLGDVAFDEPHLAEAIVRNAIADASYLSQHAPAGYNRADHGSLTPQAELAAIPRHEIESFMRRVQALNDPLSVAEAIAHGDLSLEGIDALKARRPEMYQELRVDIIRATSERDKPLPFTRRAAIGIAFDFPADRSLDREYAARLQQDFAARAQQAQKQAPPPPPKGETDSGKIMTPSQKLAIGA